MAKKAANSDKRVQLLIEEVQKRKAEIEGAERPNWKTNCVFDLSGKKINLHVESDVERLTLIAAYLLTTKSARQEAQKLLGVTETEDFVVQGFVTQDWLEDLKTRANRLQIDKKRAELAKYEKALDKLISPEMRKEMELAAIEKELLG